MPLPVLYMEIIAGSIIWTCKVHEWNGKTIHVEQSNSIIDTEYNMIVWLLKNNYIKTNQGIEEIPENIANIIENNFHEML